MRALIKQSSRYDAGEGVVVTPPVSVSEPARDPAPAALERCERLIATKLGLHIRERDRDDFHRTVSSRVSFLRLVSVPDYERLLQSNSSAGAREWEELSNALTNNESYFFRDQEQHALLRNRILPELIERNRAQLTLKLWSAGCSTGEEPYSLAMLVNELLPRREGWRIKIVGTDLSEQALTKARHGVYGAWSFRMANPAWQQRFFQQRGEHWELQDSIRRMVEFHAGNLVLDEFPRTTSDLYDMDLILCRNVFIYFEPSATASVMHKLAATLSPSGYLMTGHAELSEAVPAALRLWNFSESVVYQKVDARPRHLSVPVASVSSPSWPVPPVRPAPARTDAARDPVTAAESSAVSGHPRAVAPPGDEDMMVELETLLRAGEHDAVLKKGEVVLQREPDNFAALLAAARAHANLGEHGEAIMKLLRASEARPFAMEPHYLLAHVAVERGEHDEAKTCLRKAIYLAPASAPAYLELGALYSQEGDSARARKMRSTALELLRSLPPTTPVEFAEEHMAGELAQQVEALLAREQ